MTVTGVRRVVDTEGRYGAPGASPVVTEVSTDRDGWLDEGGRWTQVSRAQVGPPTSFVDRRDPTD